MLETFRRVLWSYCWGPPAPEWDQLPEQETLLCLAPLLLVFNRLAGLAGGRMGPPRGQMFKPHFTWGDDLAKVMWQGRGRVMVGT